MRNRSVLLLVLLAGCSSRDANEAEKFEPIILCTAEAIKASRDPARSRAQQDLWRAKAALLEEKLPPAHHNKAHAEVEQLADRNRGTTLIDPARCEALLSEADRLSLKKDQP